MDDLICVTCGNDLPAFFISCRCDRTLRFFCSYDCHSKCADDD